MKKDYRQLDKHRQEHMLKSLYYNRYFMIRYITIFFFFVQLYWFLMFILSTINGAMVLPSILLLVNGIAVWEQTRQFTTTQKPAKYTRINFQAIIMSNICILLAILFGQGNVIYPFLNMTSQHVGLTMRGILIVGIAISVLCIQKLNQIDSKNDKQYKRIENYLKNKK